MISKILFVTKYFMVIINENYFKFLVIIYIGRLLERLNSSIWKVRFLSCQIQALLGKQPQGGKHRLILHLDKDCQRISLA